MNIDHYNTMQVIKRNGKKEPVSFDKITKRIGILCKGLEKIDPVLITQKVCTQIYDGVLTSDIDELAAQISYSMMTSNPDFGILASRIIISNNHKNTSPSFSETISMLYNNTDKNGNHSPLIDNDVYRIVMENKEKLNDVIDYHKDYKYDYFAFKTLEKSYLMKIKRKVVERIQHMLMRVSIGLHKDNLNSAIDSYVHLSLKYFIHATPTLYHAGTPRPQLLSCFLLGTGDSIDEIFKTLANTASISKWAGGIGLHISNIRSKDSLIRGTNGKSTGIIPMLRVFNATGRYVNQCFTPETPIYTRMGIKEIKDITSGSEILTSDGTFKHVNHVFSRNCDEEIIKYKINSSLYPVRCTKQHQIFVLKNAAKINNHQKIKEELKNGNISGEYISAGDLTVKDYIAFPIPVLIDDDDNENEDFYYYLYGMTLMNSRREDNKIKMEMDEHLMGKVKTFFQSRNIKFEREKKKTITWNLEDDIFHHDERENNRKKLYREFWNLPKNKVLNILKGIFYKKNLEIRLRHYEKDFVSTIRYLLLRLGILGRGVFKNSIYHFTYPKEIDGKKNNRYFEHDGKLYCKISKIKYMRYKGSVYDLNIAENHNYTTDNGLVHNSGKRNGAIAIYLEPHHPDIMEFLDLRKNHGYEEERARDLFLAMWISDLFMERVEGNEKWSLFDPDECPGLNDVYGEKYKKLYAKYEMEGKARKVVNAREIWRKIIESQIETGVPYILFKDAANLKSNQQNIGTIKSSNLCAEILEYSDNKEYACCVLASISLPAFVESNNGKMQYNYDKLIQVVKIAIRNLNKIIDLNYYPVSETKISNMKHRPLGLGVQGLADVFFKMKIPYDSEKAREINRNIFETMYYAAVMASCELAKKEGPYSTFEGSPMSRGQFQFDLWNTKPSDRWDWNKLREEVKKYGVRNSLLIALMPTATTSQILSNNETFEPITSNFYVRRTMAGEFIIVNKYLVDDLIKLGLWNSEMKDIIIANNGSIQSINNIPQELKELYKTAWEMKQKALMDLAIDRAPFICQTQSMNLFFEEPTQSTLTSALFYAWKKGLKTGCYYLRSRPKVQAQQFTIDPELIKKAKGTSEGAKLLCSLANPEACEQCSG